LIDHEANAVDAVAEVALQSGPNELAGGVREGEQVADADLRQVGAAEGQADPGEHNSRGSRAKIHRRPVFPRGLRRPTINPED
jgi:hypothetical protein